MNQPNVYRTPKDPGYVGGYNWSSLVAGILLLVGTNFAATQFIAHRFGYQPALGRSGGEVAWACGLSAIPVGVVGVAAREFN